MKIYRHRKVAPGRERVGLSDDLGPLASGVHVSRQIGLGLIGFAPTYKDAPRAAKTAEGHGPKEQHSNDHH